MSDESFAELAKLKQRLESLGVKIKGGSTDSVYDEPAEDENDDMNRLLARCHRVEATLDGTPGRHQRPLSSSSPAPGRSSPAVHGRDAHANHSPVRGSRPRPTRRPSTTPAAAAAVQRTQKLPQRTSRTSPLSSLLGDFRDAEARWNQEKAEMRRQLAAEKKRATKLETSLKKVTNLYEARLVDVKALKSALANRDDQLKAAGMHTKRLEEQHQTAMDDTGQQVAAITRERDDVKALLVATLQRLEAVDDVVRRADMSNAVMEERVGVLEQERTAAVESASAAQARVDELVKSQRRVEWQNKMLDRISEVQMVHNRQKTHAMHELLDHGKGDQASTCADTDVP